MKRVIMKHSEIILFDGMVDAFGNIFVKECIDSIYLKTLQMVVKGKYKIEFIDEIFTIEEGSVFRNIEKFRRNPLYKDKIIIKDVSAEDVLEFTQYFKSDDFYVDLEEICNFFNIELIEKEYLTVEGVCSRNENGNYTISYKNDLPWYKKRFVIAYALGYIFLHMSEENKRFILENISFNSRTSNNKNIKEALLSAIWVQGLSSKNRSKRIEEAKDFAVDLLVPKTKLKKAFNRYGYKVGLLSRLFEVPQEIINRQLQRTFGENEVVLVRGNSFSYEEGDLVIVPLKRSKKITLQVHTKRDEQYENVSTIRILEPDIIAAIKSHRGNVHANG